MSQKACLEKITIVFPPSSDFFLLKTITRPTSPEVFRGYTRMDIRKTIQTAQQFLAIR